MLQPNLLDQKPKLAPISVESGGVLIAQDDNDPTAAWVEVNGQSIKLNYHDLDMFARRLSLFMTAINYQKQGWPRPYVQD